MDQPIGGFVIVSDDGKFLSRKLRWVRHPDGRHSLPGTRRAWVHSIDAILTGGKWTADAAKLMPACFDPIVGHTAIAGHEKTFLEFQTRLARLEQLKRLGERDPSTPWWM